MQEAPIYFKGPDEDVTEVDPYEEFKVVETETEEALVIPENNEEIILDDDSSFLNIDDIIERSGKTLDKTAEPLKSLSDEVAEDIVSGVNDAIENPIDFYRGLDGKKYIKDQLLEFEELKDLIDGIQSVYGKICLDGFIDTEIRNPVSDATMKDLLNKGIFDFASCFLKELIEEGNGDFIKNNLIKSGTNLIGSDSMSTVSWLSDNLDSGAIDLFDNSFADSLVSKYLLPPSVTDKQNEINRIENSMKLLNVDWFSSSFVSLNKTQSYFKENIEVISNASDSMLEVLNHSDDYKESIIVTEAYDKETEFNNYPYSI